MYKHVYACGAFLRSSVHALALSIAHNEDSTFRGP